MLKFKVSLILVFIWPILSAQEFPISKDEAWQIVKEKVLLNKLQDVNVYFEKSTIEGNSVTKSVFTEVESPPFTSWFFFVDDKPLANWGHSCRYVYVNAYSGEFEIKNNILPPDLTKLDTIFQYKPLTRGNLFDFTTNKKSLLNVCSSANEYAVIISGGANAGNNFERYWNDCAAIYSALVNIYGYSDNHIYVLISDGTSTSNDRHLISGGYDSSPLDLDGDGDNDIDYSASTGNITTVFNILSSILNSDNNLFIFTTDHGAQISGDYAYMNLWYQTITDNQFATEVAKVNAGRIMIMMEQCYSGGFIDDLAGSNKVIATACDYDEPSYARTDLTYDEFAYHWISAVAGETPGGTPVDADYDNDGFISMYNAFIYASNSDTKNETPQYNSTPSDMGTHLAMNGKIPYISGDDIVCYSPNKTFTLNNRPPNTSVSWSRSNNLYLVSGTTTTNTVRAQSSSTASVGWLQTSITSGGCTPITVRRDIWVGKPDPTITGEQYPECDDINWYFLDPDDKWGTYYWNVTYGLTIIGSPYGYKAQIRADEEGNAAIYCNVTNACGTNYGSLMVYVSCYGFKISPNPADEYVEISLDDNKIDLNNINEYEIKIYNDQQILVYQIKTTQPSININTIKFQDGLYIVNLIYEGKMSSMKFVIEH